jgi:biotin carboxylase
MSAGTLLLVGSGKQQYREFELRSIAARYDVVLLVPHKVTWEREYVSRWETIDFENDAEFQSRGGAFARETGAAGLLTWSDRVGERCARLARSLELPCAEPAAIAACKDKSAFRQRLQDRPGWSVRSLLVHDLDAARRAAATIGYPVVIKPRSLGGSIGVVRIDAEPQLADAFRGATSALAGGLPAVYPGAVVEEYIEGKEYSVDCLTVGGETVPLIVAEKSQGAEPYFEEIGHLVPAPESPALTAAVTMVCEVHRALGIDNLATCSEFRLTADGPRLIEVNARFGGDFTSRLGQLALGLDLPLAAADLAMGRTPQLEFTAARVAAVRFFRPAHDIQLNSVRLRGSQHAGLVAFEPLVRAGSRLRLPPRGYADRLAYAIVAGVSREECLRNLDEVEAAVVVDGTAIS